MEGTRRTLLVAAPIALVGLLVASSTGAAWAATSWLVALQAASAGEAHAQTLPSAPAGATATCNAPSTSQTINVSWSAVTHAATYSVYDSTTSATGTYTLVASGVSTTSWTSGALTAGTNYWFKVTVSVGSHWASAKSSATTESTIDFFSPYCVQP